MKYTLADLRRIKVYALDNATYNKVKDECTTIMADAMAKKMMESIFEHPASDLYNCTGHDFTKCFDMF